VYDEGVVYDLCLMSVLKLTDLSLGDTVAYRQFHSQEWYRVKVASMTTRCIVIDYDPDTKFWKSSGLATSKEYPDSEISIVTSEMQECWDREEGKLGILRSLKKGDDISVEALKKIAIKLIGQSDCSKFAYIECIKAILLTNGIPSDCLIGVIEILATK